MLTRRAFDRRKFLTLAGGATGALMLPGCGGGGGDADGAATATSAATGAASPPAAETSAVVIGVGAWAEEATRQVIDELGFTDQTGIGVEVVVRPGTPEEFQTQIASGIQSGQTPYDVIDFEDEPASNFSPAGWLLDLRDILPADFWEDWPEPMIAMSELWGQHEGELHRIHHNYEANYWWYRADWFEEEGVAVPTTWDEVRALGEVFTGRGDGVFASTEGLSGVFLSVYMQYLSRQAGGDPFAVDDGFAEALQYAHDLLYTDNVLNPAGLQHDYEAQNAAYLADRVAFMRQWPFFWDVARGATDWFDEGKAAIALPPVGPGGADVSTFATGWGFGIPAATEKPDEAKELVRFLVDTNNAGEMARINTWFLSARHSVLEAVGDEGIAPFLREYSDAGVITTRPHRSQFFEASEALTSVSSAYLSQQTDLDEALEQARSRFEAL